MKKFLLKDAEAEKPAEEESVSALGWAEWEALKAAYDIPSDHGIVCIVEFDEDADKPARLFARALDRACFCLFDHLGSRGCFFLSGGVKCGAAEKLLASICETLKDYFCIFGVGENRPGVFIELSFMDALNCVKSKMNRPERRQKDRLRIKELRRRIGAADPDEMWRLFRLLTGDIFTNSTFTLAKTRIIVIFTLLWDDLTGYWGGGKWEDPRTYINDEIGKLDIREIMAWKILHLKTITEWESWSEKAFNFLLKIAKRRAEGFPPPLLKAMDYIQEHYKEDLDRCRAAEAARVSPAYLSRLFSQNLNTTFHGYLTDLRIEKAGQLLQETCLSIKEISFAAGFKSPDYFGKVFKKTKGISAGDARRK